MAQEIWIVQGKNKVRLTTPRGVDVSEEVNNSIRVTLQRQVEEIIGKVILANPEGETLALIETIITELSKVTTAVEKTDLVETRPVKVTKALEAYAIYEAEDVLAENDTNGVGTAWVFSNIAKAIGGKGYITKAIAVSETTALTPRLVLFLYNAMPTCELDDHAPNTSPINADVINGNFVGTIEFPAMKDIGTGKSYAVASPSTYGNVPLEFTCANDSASLIGVLVTLDAFTQTAGDDMTIILVAEV